MSELTFSQTERRSFLVPLLIAFVIVGGVFAYIYLRPHRIADITITHTAILPTHTVFKDLSKVVGHEDQAEDDLYVLTTIRIDNRLKIPLTIDDITGTLTPPDDSAEPATTSAIKKGDSTACTSPSPRSSRSPALRLLRETTIEPGDHAEGMVILHFPSPRPTGTTANPPASPSTSTTSDPFTVPIPKDRGTGNGN